MIHQATIFFGTSSFAVPILEALAQSPWRPRVVVTTPDGKAGRGLALKPSPVKQTALRHSLECWEPEDLRDPVWRERFKAIDPGLIILAAYGGIIPLHILLLPASGSLNVHPSLLPRWRGPAPIQWAILEGDEITGATIFLMDEKVDHGPILTQEAITVMPEDTARTLQEKLSALGAVLLARTLPDWLEGRITPRPQDHAAATYSGMFTKRDGFIDWNAAAARIARQVRALAGWPGAATYARVRQRLLLLKIHAASISAPHTTVTTKNVAPGMVLQETAKLLVATGDGVLEITAIQPEGKRPMSGAQFLNGYREVLGTVFTQSSV